MDLKWWIAVIGVPLVVGLISAIIKCFGYTRNSVLPLWDSLNEFKMHVAEKYSNKKDNDSVEKRLNSRLDRIECKINGKK